VPEIRKWHNGGIMDGTALDRVLVHVRRGSRVVKRAVDPADVYLLEADGGDTLVRMRGARGCVRELRPRDEGDDWEVKLDPPVNRVLPVARGELARLEAAFDRPPVIPSTR
jgi:hypothetical protein